MKIIKIWHDPVWSKVISGIILGIFGAVVTLIYSVIKEIKFLEALIVFYDIFISILFFQVSLIWIILIIIIIYFLRKVLKNRFKLKPEWLNYKNDILKKYLWTWEYKYDEYDEKWQIVEMSPHCHNCECILHYKSGNIECPNCGNIYGYNYYEDLEEIKKMIINKIEKRRYKLN